MNEQKYVKYLLTIEAVELKRKEAYKLCWQCNKKFRGNKKYPKHAHVNSNSFTQLVYVHKSCLKPNPED